MCDVTRENFHELFPLIKKSIEDASFIAIDGEFTGLSTSNTYEPTLFDSSEVRYSKLKRSLSKFTVCQFGIACFVPGTLDNSYDAHVFNFYLCPASLGPIDPKFTCQVSALKFLTNHNFDFNKFIKKGVPYLNKHQEEILRCHHGNGSVQHNMSSLLLKQIDSEYVNPVLQKIEAFLKTDLTNDVLILPEIPDGIELYLVLKSIEKRFSNLNCDWDDISGKITVQKVLDINHTISFDHLYERLIQRTVGVTNILNLITKNQKPVIGHNMFSDLILIHERFFRQLPESYKAFKKTIHEAFPKIYDTKHISYIVRKDLRDSSIDFGNSLEELYQFFSSTTGFHHKIYTPRIKFAEHCQKYNNIEQPHEAGYDAYLTGFVFIKLAHFIATKEIRLTDEKPLDFSEHLYALREFLNCVNLSRAAVRYVKFDSSDSPLSLPERFIVNSRLRKKALSASQVAQDFLPFGSVDVQMRSKYEALIAVSHRKRARNLVKAFSRNKHYKVEEYDWWKHSKKGQAVWYSGLASITVVSVVSCVYLWKRLGG